jgi:hypothetical protein
LIWPKGERRQQRLIIAVEKYDQCSIAMHLVNDAVVALQWPSGDADTFVKRKRAILHSCIITLRDDDISGRKSNRYNDEYEVAV